MIKAICWGSEGSFSITDEITRVKIQLYHLAS